MASAVIWLMASKGFGSGVASCSLQTGSEAPKLPGSNRVQRVYTVRCCTQKTARSHEVLGHHLYNDGGLLHQIGCKCELETKLQLKVAT